MLSKDKKPWYFDLIPNRYWFVSYQSLNYEGLSSVGNTVACGKSFNPWFFQIQFAKEQNLQGCIVLIYTRTDQKVYDQITNAVLNQLQRG